MSRFHLLYHSPDVMVSSDGKTISRRVARKRDLQETVKQFAGVVSERGRAIHEIWAFVFNVLHLLHSTGAEKVRWSPPSWNTTTCSCTLGVTVIIVLCYCGEHLSDEMMQGLVDYILDFKYVDVNEEDKTDYNWTLLHHCAEAGNARLAKLLIERSACLNAQASGARWTPLHYAVDRNKISVVKVILSHASDSINLDTTLLDRYYRTALDLAKERGYNECVQLITQHEAETSCQADSES
ncbi:uncharacterized protein LOC135827293 [Sycon ciliatum]|uniref:uncharacterized protein LOC135827293 n=1 Tax=Sycon ciliatum TaxID=27933 RepID=UPI0031F62881